jgi:iron complex outermembrane receptor protein
VTNVFDEEYTANVRLNAFGGRYFEPAPGRNGYAGVSLNYRFR